MLKVLFGVTKLKNSPNSKRQTLPDTRPLILFLVLPTALGPLPPGLAATPQPGSTNVSVPVIAPSAPRIGTLYRPGLPVPELETELLVIFGLSVW